ncbi:hypothetical protein Cri9333_4142 [Crinalium epipsammum PCC 9333]|uniref:Uncharacterized protein n=1 Tax=Crinalium epipsammum PCC 9333 TaxID=1173022 RepID=K9W3Z6_9CYAN|nr:hypothetical protein [Crinalium epipsammum]AFZ14936.1 hypothetical protein Cri9333_4142 [Crinalium epipsammum PCC 9333]
MNKKILFGASTAFIALTSLAVATVQQMPRAVAHRANEQVIAHHTPSPLVTS